MRLFGSIEDKHGMNDPDYEHVDAPESHTLKRVTFVLLMVGTFPVGPIAYLLWRWRPAWLDAKRALAIAVATLLFLAWHAGTFDHILYNVGLNAKQCGRNGFGATFCGQELKERLAQQEETKERLQTVKHEGEEAQGG